MDQRTFEQAAHETGEFTLRTGRAYVHGLVTMLTRTARELDEQLPRTISELEHQGIDASSLRLLQSYLQPLLRKNGH